MLEKSLLWIVPPRKTMPDNQTVPRALCRPHCRPHLQNVQKILIFSHFFCEIEFSLHSVAHFPHRRAKPQKQTPSSGDHARPLYPRKCSQPLIHAFPTASRPHFVDLLVHLIVQKWSETISFLRFYVVNYLMTTWLTYEIKLSLQSRAHFVDLIFKKCKMPSVFCVFFCEIELSLQSRAHFVDLIFKKCKKKKSPLFEIELSLQSRPHFVDVMVQKWSERQFFTILCDQLLGDDVIHIWNRALATVSRAFCRPHLQNVQNACYFFYDFLCEIELSLQSCAHFVAHFPDRGAQPRKQRTPQRRPRTATLPQKTQSFAPESLSSRDFTRSRSRHARTLPTSIFKKWSETVTFFNMFF